MADIECICDRDDCRACWLRTQDDVVASSMWEIVRDEIDSLNSLGPDWDGEGAEPVTQELINATIGFCKVLEENGYLAPVGSVYAIPDGTVMVECANQCGVTLSANVREPGQIELLYKEPGKELTHVNAMSKPMQCICDRDDCRDCWLRTMDDTAEIVVEPVVPDAVIDPADVPLVVLMKDMTKREFDEACRRRGFRPVGLLGYYEYRPENGAGTVMVSALNAGPTRRQKLAYLIQQFCKSTVGQ